MWSALLAKLTSSKLAQSLLRWLGPIAWRKLKEYISGLYEDFKEARAVRAKKQARDKAEKKYEEIKNDPNSTPQDVADAYQDFINASSSGEHDKL